MIELKTLKKYLTKFVTITDTEGHTHSGYIGNVDAIRRCQENHIRVQLVNGFLVDSVDTQDIAEITEGDRSQASGIPEIVPDETNDFVLYKGPADDELRVLYRRYQKQFHDQRPDTDTRLKFGEISLEGFKKLLKACLKMNKTMDQLVEEFGGEKKNN
jgi:hypothetical protein